VAGKIKKVRYAINSNFRITWRSRTEDKKDSSHICIWIRLDYRWIALRSVEVHRCFSNSGSAQLAFLDLPNVMRIGQITRLANMMRRRGIISYDSIRALGALLGMQPDTINSNLRIMESLTWVTLSRKPKGVFVSVEDHIPNLEKVLSTLGEIYLDTEQGIPNVTQLSGIEQSSISVLHLCSRKPVTVESLKSELNLDSKQYQKVVDLGTAGGYLEPISLADKKEAFWSPVYYYNQYDNIKKFMQRQTVSSLTPIGEAIEMCAETVGIPLQLIPKDAKQAAIAGMKCGAILPINLQMPSESGKVDYTFLFPPLSKFEDSDPKGDFLEKSKVLLASFRLGENFAPTSKIKNPQEVIRKLKVDGKLSRPHSDAFDQYKVPASRGIFVLKRETGKTFWRGEEYTGWMPYLIRSEENIKALEIVESLITPSSQRISDTLVEDIKTADNVFGQTLNCLETLEFRGSSNFKSIFADPKLERGPDDKDLPLKLRMMNLLWNLGWFVKPNAKLYRYEEGRRTSYQFTDIDVLATKFLPLQNPIIAICSAKSGKESDASQIFWLAGVKSYFGASFAYYVRSKASLSMAKSLCEKLDIIALNEEQLSIMEKRFSVGSSSTQIFNSKVYKQIHNYFREVKENKPALYNITERFWIDQVNNQLLRAITATRDVESISLSSDCKIYMKYYLAALLSLPIYRLAHLLITVPTNMIGTELDTALMGGELARTEKERTINAFKSFLAEFMAQAKLPQELSKDSDNFLKNLFKLNFSGDLSDVLISMVEHYRQSLYVPRMLDVLSYQIAKTPTSIPKLDYVTVPDLPKNDWEYAAKLAKDVLIFLQRIGVFERSEIDI